MRSPFQNVVYIQLKRRWMSIRVLSWAGGDSRWEGVPDFQLARDKRGRTRAIERSQEPGHTATETLHCQLCTHPRTLVESPDLFASGLALFVRLAGYKPSLAKPLVIFHIRESLAGGLTPLEQRGFQQAASRLSAGKVAFCTEEHELLPPDVLELAKRS